MTFWSCDISRSEFYPFLISDTRLKGPLISAFTTSTCVQITIVDHFSSPEKCKFLTAAIGPLILWTAYVRGAFNKFTDFFVQAFKIVTDSWKFDMLLVYILWDDWPIFMISGSNEQQQLEYTLLKPDCHSWGISTMQSGLEDTLEERYAIKLFKTWTKGHRNVWNASDCFWSILHESSISFWVA